jgi:hypothetical protein
MEVSSKSVSESESAPRARSGVLCLGKASINPEYAGACPLLMPRKILAMKTQKLKTSRVSKNRSTIEHLRIACRHVDELVAAKVSENLAISTLELFADVYAKLLTVVRRRPVIRPPVRASRPPTYLQTRHASAKANRPVYSPVFKAGTGGHWPAEPT